MQTLLESPSAGKSIGLALFFRVRQTISYSVGNARPPCFSIDVASPSHWIIFQNPAVRRDASTSSMASLQWYNGSRIGQKWLVYHTHKHRIRTTNNSIHSILLFFICIYVFLVLGSASLVHKYYLDRNIAPVKPVRKADIQLPANSGNVRSVPDLGICPIYTNIFVVVSSHSFWSLPKPQIH